MTKSFCAPDEYGLPPWTFLCIRKKKVSHPIHLYATQVNSQEYLLGTRRLQQVVSHCFSVNGGADERWRIFWYYDRVAE